MNEQCLGIDWGTVRIGLSLGNAETKIASPLGVVGSLDALLDMAKSEKIDRLVVGNPLHSHGTARPENKAFTAFVEALEARSGLPLTLIDERFSSQSADKLGAGTKRDGERDAIAAMIILQTYFDNLPK